MLLKRFILFGILKYKSEKQNYKQRKLLNGFTLVEISVGIFILILGIIGVVTVFSRIISIFPIVSSRLVAAYLGKEGMEIVRNIRDTNWLKNKDFEADLIQCSFGCEADYKTGTIEQEIPLRSYRGNYLNIDNNNFYSYSSGIPTKYQRKIIIEKINNDALKVSVDVYWQVRGKSYDFKTEGYLYNWK